jgi:hypothetical protein
LLEAISDNRDDRITAILKLLRPAADPAGLALPRAIIGDSSNSVELNMHDHNRVPQSCEQSPRCNADKKSSRFRTVAHCLQEYKHQTKLPLIVRGRRMDNLALGQHTPYVAFKVTVISYFMRVQRERS